MDEYLLETGYTQNRKQFGGKAGFVASQRSYNDQTWSRDLDYATRGYSYALHDMSALRQNIELFLDRERGGVVPEVIYAPGSPHWNSAYGADCGRKTGYEDWVCGDDYANRASWDSMPNIIQAVYVYTAKTGDRELYENHKHALNRVGDWISYLDTNGDNLPDEHEFKHGYYDSTTNGVQHTYAIAKFYNSYNQLAELTGDYGKWGEKARLLKQAFLSSDLYWQGEAWPIAWKNGDLTVTTLETFGVFEAIQSGLIAPGDPQYDPLMKVMNDNIDAFLSDRAPFKLTLDGYLSNYSIEQVRRDRNTPYWMMNASAPWVSGLAAPAYAYNGNSGNARQVMDKYAEMVAWTGNPPVLEFMAGDNQSANQNGSPDRGRFWDTAAWFMAVYGGHYGLDMKLDKLVVAPHPFKRIENDTVQQFMYQGKQLNLDIISPKTYQITNLSNESIPVLLKPMSGGGKISVNGSELVSSYDATIHAGETYVVSTDRRSSPASENEQPEIPRENDTDPSGVPQCPAGYTDAYWDETSDSDDPKCVCHQNGAEHTELRDHNNGQDATKEQCNGGDVLTGDISMQSVSPDSDSDSDSSPDQSRNDSEQCPESVRKASGDERRRKEVFFCAAYQNYHKAEFEEFGCPCGSGRAPQ